MVHLRADELLLLQVFLHLLFYHLSLVNNLYGILLHSICVWVAPHDQVDLPKLPLPQLLDVHELLHRNRFGNLHQRLVVLLDLLLMTVLIHYMSTVTSDRCIGMSQWYVKAIVVRVA